MPLCASCFGETAFEQDPSNGTAYCPLCGAVAEENGIVSEITFGETGAGAAVVSGSFVGADQTRARFGGGRRPGGGGVESREQTIANGRREIIRVVNSLKLPDRMADSALRFYTLALNNNFTRGRRVLYVVAACVYIVCRLEKKEQMLIDFSDLMQINVFVLGSTYMKLVKELNLKDIPVIDPAIFISRFANLLEFGEETQQVASDATRLVNRFSRDWINQGRRPAGICGACLILAARMNNFRRSVEEVVQVVKIADVTLRARLEEFATTDTSRLSIQDFRSAWLDEAADPPAFKEGQQRAYRERVRLAQKAKAQRKRDRKGKGAAAKFGDNEANDGEALSDLPEEDEDVEDVDLDEEDEEALLSGEDKEARMRNQSGAAFSELNAQMEGLEREGGAGLAAEEEEQEGEAEMDSQQTRRAASADENGHIADGNATQATQSTQATQPVPAGPTQDDPDQEEQVEEEDDEDEDEDEDEDFDGLGGIDNEGNVKSALAAGDTADKGRRRQGSAIHSGSKSQLAAQAKELGWKNTKDIPRDTRTAEERERDEAESAAIASDITTELAYKPFSIMSSELSDKERARYIAAQDPALRAQMASEPNDRLSDLDEDELDAMILTAEEVRIKERLWMEFNKDYLEKTAERHLRAELDEKPLRNKERKKRAKPRDSTTATGETAAEATRQLLKQKKFSKKINYAAIDALLNDEDGGVDGIDGIDGGKKGSNLFDEDEDRWERESSRAGSVVSSVGGKGKGRGRGKGKKKSRSRSLSAATDGADAESEALRLKKDLEKGNKRGKRALGAGSYLDSSRKKAKTGDRASSPKKVNPETARAVFGNNAAAEVEVYGEEGGGGGGSPAPGSPAGSPNAALSPGASSPGAGDFDEADMPAAEAEDDEMAEFRRLRGEEGGEDEDYGEGFEEYD